MPVRLVITTYAKPGKGAELAQALAAHCRAVQQEPGCQQFEVFQSALDPDKLVVLELWVEYIAPCGRTRRVDICGPVHGPPTRYSCFNINHKK